MELDRDTDRSCMSTSAGVEEAKGLAEAKRAFIAPAELRTDIDKAHQGPAGGAGF